MNFFNIKRKLRKCWLELFKRDKRHSSKAQIGRKKLFKKRNSKKERWREARQWETLTPPPPICFPGRKLLLLITHPLPPLVLTRLHFFSLKCSFHFFLKKLRVYYCSLFIFSRQMESARFSAAVRSQKRRLSPSISCKTST